MILGKMLGNDQLRLQKISIFPYCIIILIIIGQLDITNEINNHNYILEIKLEVCLNIVRDKACDGTINENIINFECPIVLLHHYSRQVSFCLK